MPKYTAPVQVGVQPRIFINAKVYPQVTGAGALRLAEVCAAVADETGVPVGLAPPLVELADVGRPPLDGVQVFAQHVDALPPGSGTGWTTAEAIHAAGAAGAIVNHAEHKIPHDDVAATLARLREVGLQSLVCTDSMDETRALAPLRPTYIAIEPPELIGGDVSVTTADPSIVSDAAALVAEAAPGTLTLCGAGVKTRRDVAQALELGAHGVLVASGVVAAADPAAALRDLASGL